ncbi:hypothetical protein SOVF_135780 [Spinacia oleracea]|nr:hypothetical protein SOVF_135780 [Spinacia oleracea]
MERRNKASADGDNGKSGLIFLGTGCSSGVPSARCLIQPSHPPCPVCSLSVKIPPQNNPNYRCNTSLLIDYCQENGDHKYIIIDVGKTFREQVLRWFTHYKVPRIDSVLFTHEHADAVLGINDLDCVNNEDSAIPVYGTQECVDSVVARFPHLCNKIAHKQNKGIGEAAFVDWRLIENHCEKPFIASGLQFHPLPVMHGEDYIALGFLFGDKSKVAYVSDVSRFPSSTEYAISKGRGAELDLLILDTNCIYLNGHRNTHFCFPEVSFCVFHIELYSLRIYLRDTFGRTRVLRKRIE